MLFRMNLVFIIFQLIVPIQGRLVELRGDPFTRGKLLGEILQKNITALFVKKQSQYGDKFKEFEDYAAHIKPLIAEFAPTTYQELSGNHNIYTYFACFCSFILILNHLLFLSSAFSHSVKF